MPLADPPRPSMELTSVQQVVDYLIGYVRWFSDFINHIDTLNVEELDAAVVNTGILNANLVKIAAANGLKSFTIDTNGIVANNGSVDTMKFDLATGLLTIVSALIQSATGYPRVELNNSTNLLGAYQTANESIRIDPAGTSGDPILSFFHGSQRKGFMQYLSPDILLITPVGVSNITMSSGITLNLIADQIVNVVCSAFRMNGNIGQTASIPYVKNVTAGVPSFGNMNFTNGILTSWT